MDVYLPIAEVTQNILVLLGLGLAVGMLTGMFGVGGGFLLTPALMLIGIPQPVAVATAANQLVGASVAGAIGHARRGNIDFKMGCFTSLGGFLGSLGGVLLFGVLRRLGQIDLTISLGFVILLGTLGTMMLIESIGAILRDSAPGARRRRLHEHAWFHRLPFKLRFRRSKLYISALLPVGLGMVIGLLSGMLGIGGGFIAIPVMIYLFGMPAIVVPGTSLFQSVFIAAMTTILQAITNQTVDGLLAILTLIGGLAGVHWGGFLANRIRGDYLRVLLAVVVLSVGTKLLYDLTAAPEHRYSISVTSS
jgi:uncharacterized membrane protein YfcA